MIKMEMTSTVNEYIINKILSRQYPDANIEFLECQKKNITKLEEYHLCKVCRLVIHFKKNGEKREKIIFLKVATDIPDVYQTMKKYDIFKKEATMYSEILPQLYAICDDEYFTPKLYYVDEWDSLFLEDLTQSGYQCLSQYIGLDLEHSYHVLRCLARLHAYSIKLEKTNGINNLVKKPARSLKDANDQLLQDYSAGMRAFINVLPSDMQYKYQKQIEFMRKITAEELLKEWNSTFSFNVLIHGDLRTSNIMFKYSKKCGILDSNVKLIDFQFCRWTSPIFDLIYFAITSMEFHTFENHFDDLLKLYLDNLNKILKTLGCEEMYEMRELQKDMKKLRYFLILVIGVILALISKNSDHGDGPVEASVEKTHFSRTISRSHQSKIYIEKAKRWFAYFAKNGAFD